MSDDKLDFKLNIDVNVDAEELKKLRSSEFHQMEAELQAIARAAKAATSSLSALGRGKAGATGTADGVKNSRDALDLDRTRYAELKRIFVFQRRMAAQEKREHDDLARQFKAQEKERENALKAQAKLASTAAKARAKAEAEAEKRTRDEIRETTRLRDRENRKALQDADRLRRAQERAAERAAQGASRARSGAGQVAASGGAAAALMGYGAARAISRGVHTRADADEAETNIRIFNDVDDGKGGRRKLNADDIRKLRRGPDGLDRLAVDTGTSVPETLRAYNESAKAGLIDPLGQTRNVLKAGAALELDPGKTTKLLGTMARNMGAAATPSRMYRTLNAVGIGAREDPTQSNEIIEGLNRSQGLLAMSRGFTPEDLVAMVSGGQSVGIQPGKAGTSIMALGSSILQGGSKFLDPKKRKELNFAAKHLGFASAKDMANQFAGENGKATYYRIMRGLQGMAPQLRQQVANALSGGQWSDEDLQIVNGIDGQIKTDQEIHDPRNANFIDEAAAEKMKSWKMLWAQSSTIFSLFWESFGVGFDGILREINAFFLDLNQKFNYDQVSQYVRDALDGLKEGLGLTTWTEGLKAIFPENIEGLETKIKDFARGFGEGAKAVGSLLKSVGSSFGFNGSAASIGELAAKFLLLSTAALALSPVMGILGGLAGIIAGVAGMARAAMAVLGMGGGAAVGGLGGGAVAAALASVGRLLAGGFIVSLAGTIGSMRGEIVTMMIDAVKPLLSAVWEGIKKAFTVEGLKSAGSAALDELTPAWLQRWLEGDKAAKPGQGTDENKPWVDPPARGTSEAPAAKTATEKLVEENQKQTELLQQQLAVDQKALEATQQQNHRGTSRDAQVRSMLDESRRYVRGADGSGSTGSGGSTDGPNIAHSTPGGSLRGVVGMNRNGVIGGDGAGGATGGDNASPDQKSGGPRSWRNNNPGNIEYGPFARSMGATGTDGRFAKFPSYEAGRKAQEKLLFESKGYRDLTLGQAIRRWAPASENNVGAYMAAMGGDSSTRMSQYTPEQRARLLDAMQRHEGWRPGTVTGGGSTSSPGGGGSGLAGLGGTSKVVENARSLLGMGSRQAAAALGSKMTAGNWCADFVTGALATANIKGIQGSIANSYLAWGQRVTDGVKAGDVVVTHRGQGVGQVGGHVGLATGQTRMKNGRLQYQTISGNHGNRVGEGWEYADRVAVRRAQEEMQRTTDIADRLKAQSQDVGDGIKSSGWKRVGPAGDGGAAGPGASLGSGAPGRTLGENVPLSGRANGGGASYGRVGHNISNQIHINGEQKNPKEVANEVQRSLETDMNRRTHDFDGFA